MFTIKSVKRMPACILFLALIAVFANAAYSQALGDQIGIFCNGQKTPEVEKRWYVNTDGEHSPAIPSVPKMLHYPFTIADDKNGKYSFRFSSYWTFEAEIWTRALSTDEWKAYSNVKQPPSKKDTRNRSFWYVDFEMNAPQSRSSQVFVRIIPVPYDPTFSMVARVYSYGCSKSTTVQPPPPEPACRWVETMLGQPIANPYCECGGRVVDKSRCGH
ncbi:MAG TPA: hypothetical protein PKD26_11995 [Pyrinomonadaceae bacterium]|nr:hypothetical protein [Pyrinomonadaceae bacterium]